MLAALTSHSSIKEQTVEPLIVFFWLLVAIIALVAIVFRFLSLRSRLSFLKTFVEKGEVIPPALLSEEPRRWDHRGFVVAGILMVGLAAAMCLFGLIINSDMLNQSPADPDHHILFMSVFPLCMGFASFAAGRYLRAHG